MRAEALVQQILSALPAGGSVNSAVLVRFCQRLIQLRATGTWPIKLAFRMGRPGVDLVDPVQLEIPPGLDEDLQLQMRDSLIPLRDLMRSVAVEVRQYLCTYTDTDARVPIPAAPTHDTPDDAVEAVLHEISVLIATASPQELLDDLEILLHGALVMLRNDEGAQGASLARKLVRRLPTKQEVILDRLIWHCSPIQISLIKFAATQDH